MKSLGNRRRWEKAYIAYSPWPMTRKMQEQNFDV